MLFDQVTPTALNWLTNTLQADHNIPNIFLAFHTPTFYIGPNRKLELNRPPISNLSVTI